MTALTRATARGSPGPQTREHTLSPGLRVWGWCAGETHGAMTGPPTELPGTAAWGRTASVPTPRPRVGARRTVPSRGQRAPRPPRPAPRPWLSPRCGVKPISAMCSQPGHRRMGGPPNIPLKCLCSDGQTEALPFVKLNRPCARKDADAHGTAAGKRRVCRGTEFRPGNAARHQCVLCRAARRGVPGGASQAT